MLPSPSLPPSFHVLNFVSRIYVFANHPFVRVLHCFYNLGTPKDYHKPIYSGPWARTQRITFVRIKDISRRRCANARRR